MFIENSTVHLLPSRHDRVSQSLMIPPDQGCIGHHGHDARARRSQADGVARAIRGRVLDEEGEGGDDATRVAEADHPGGADDALGVAVAREVEVHDVPADDDGTGGKGAHGDEADTEVLRREVVVHGYEDGEPGRCEYAAEQDEGEAESCVVGRVRSDEAKGHCGGKWRHGVQLGLHGGVAKRFDYGCGEVDEGCRFGKQFFGKKGSGTNMWER